MNKRRKLNYAVLKNLVKISRESKHKEVENKNNLYQKVIFCPISASEINTIRETVLGLACRKRGVEPKFLYLDTNLTKNEFYSNRKEYFIFKYKIRSNIRFARKMGFKVLTTSMFSSTSSKYPDFTNFTGKDFEEFSYNGVFLGDLITASTVRTFLCNGPEWNEPAFIENAKLNAKSACRLVDIYTEFLNKEKPDKLVMSHGIYISWGPLFRVARNMNIPVDVYGSSYRKGTLRFYHNAPNAPFPLAEWPTYENQALTKEEHDILTQYIESREDQNQDNVTLFENPDEPGSALKDFIAENKEKTIFCMFTNIAWDAFAFSADGKFSDMFEWIKQTVEFFNKSDNSALIIKAHPAEDHWKTPHLYRVKTLLSGLKLEKNIYFISETEKIKPFWLYNQIDWGIIHISTVAIEMALKNIPVVTSGGGGHYSDKGFTLEPKNIDQYFDYLGKIGEKEIQFSPDIEAAKRYMYYRFFREAIPYEPLQMETMTAVKKLNFSSQKELEKGHFRSLDVIVDGILEDNPFVY